MKYRLEIKPENLELTKWSWQLFELSSDGKFWEYMYDSNYSQIKGSEKSHLKAQLAGRKALAVFQAYDADEKLLKKVTTDLTTVVEV